MVKNYLFDLDGTLLPLDEEVFLEKYMSLIGQKFYELGFDPKEMVKKLWLGTRAMIENDGEKSNEEIFWDIFYPYPDKQADLKSKLEDFYRNEFNHVFDSTSPSAYSQDIIKLLKEKGHHIYLLTNPIFPLVATKRRIEWAGLDINDFNHVTTYENSSFAKPNIKYYQDIMDKFDLKPSETMMVGNDVYEDMIASELGIKTFLITNCLKNTHHKNYNHFEQGTLEVFYKKCLMKD